MAVSPRFGLDDLLGNETVDFQVLQANNNLLDTSAAHLNLAQIFAQQQTITRTAASDAALDVRLTGDDPGSPRMRVTADGVITWAGGSIGPVAGGGIGINASSLTLGSIKAGAGTAPAPSYSFSTDPDTGLYSPSGDILGISVGGNEVNRINNQGEIRFNRTNARIGVGSGDDPNTPGERLVAINALQVTPGRLHASGGLTASTITNNGTLTQTGAATMAAGLTISATGLTVTGVTTLNSGVNVTGNVAATGRVQGNDLMATNINLFLGSDGGMYIQRSGGETVFSHQIGTPNVRVGSGFVRDLGGATLRIDNHLTISYDLTVSRNAVVTGQLNVNGTWLYAQNVGIVGSGYCGNWNGGQAWNVGGNLLASGYIYNRGSTSYRCWDNADFNFSSSVVGNYLVQRDGNGYINANYINYTGDVQGGKPTHVLGRSGDNFLRWWPASAIGPPVLSVLVTAPGGAAGTGGQWVDKATLTVNRTGYWALMVHFNIGGSSPNNWGGFTRMRWGGTIGTQQSMTMPSGGTVNFGWHTLWDGEGGAPGGAVLCTNGTVVAAQMNMPDDQGGGGNRGMNTRFCAIFVPTTAYPG